LRPCEAVISSRRSSPAHEPRKAQRLKPCGRVPG
jgi:hypothetical protein